MSVHLTDERVDAYIEGELSGAALVEVEAHLEACARCRAEVEPLRAILDEARALPREIEPRHDLWSGIAQRIESGRTIRLDAVRAGRRRTPRIRRAFLAAAAALVAVSAGATLWIAGRAEPPSVAVGRAPSSATEAVRLAALPATEAEYHRATGELLALLDRNRDQLAPETQRVLDESLAVIDAAIENLREALARDPGSQELMRLLEATYKWKVEVLNQAVWSART